MDQLQFDALTKGLASGASRRRVLGGLVGSAAAALGVGALTSLEADAKKKGKGKGKCKGKDRGRCDGKCTQLTNAKNCGACGRACASSEICANGLACQGANCFRVTKTEGNVELAANGGLTLHSDLTSEEFGSFSFKFPKGITLSKLATMETAFEFADGSICGAASPRFAIGIKSQPGLYVAVQIPTGLCSGPDSTGDSGNLIGNDEPYVWSMYGPGSDQSINTFTKVMDQFGDEKIGDLFVTLDSSNGQPQTVTLKACVAVSGPPA